MSFFRRAGAAIARFLQSPGDPAQEADRVLLYAKDVAGTSQLFARTDDGTVHPLTSASLPQVFRYTAVGGEANPFTIGAAQGFLARASANYNVQATLGGPNAVKTMQPLVASFTVNDFSLESSGALEAGDVVMLTVEDLT